MANLIEKLKELNRLKDELKVVFSDEVDKVIRVEAELDSYGKVYFNVWSKNIKTRIPLKEMKKLAKWLVDIGVYED